MLLSLIALLIACIFVQRIESNRNKDLINKQALELGLTRTQYRHNLSALSQALKDKDDITSEVSGLLKDIQLLNAQVKDLELDLELSEQLQIDEDKFQSAVEAHVLNVLSTIDLQDALQDAYFRACEDQDLEIPIEDLIK